MLQDDEYSAQLKEQLQTNPKDIQALMHLGILECRCYHFELGISILEKAVAISPSSVKAKFWLAVFYYYDFGEYAKAEALVKEAIQLNPQSPECWCLLGRLINEVDGPLEDAIDCIKKALIFAPDWPSLHNELAHLLINAGQYADAKKEIESFKQTFNFYQKHPVTMSNRVEWYYENVITGRGYDNIDNSLKRVEAKLEQN